MAKNTKFEASGDSVDLQALFDSMAGTPADKPRLEVIYAAVGDGSETDDLQALFDSVADSFDDADLPAPESDAAALNTGAPGWPGSAQSDAMYQKIGQMTRQVHDTLRALDHDGALQHAADAIPDARERLKYIAQMTEQAASRVLIATDIAMPLQARVGDGADALCVQWDKLFANELNAEQFKQLAGETRNFLGAAADDSRAAHAQLAEIVMAQGFQDITGQVIKKVLALAQALETQLLDVLIETAPEGKKPLGKEAGRLNGPVISSASRRDVVMSQAQVDDLLERLGF